MKLGCVVWLTGLPGSGKTTIARLVERHIRKLGLPVEVLDGDEVRKSLSPELGFSKQDREAHARRVVYVSNLLCRNGVVTIVALISPYRVPAIRPRDNRKGACRGICEGTKNCVASAIQKGFIEKLKR